MARTSSQNIVSTRGIKMLSAWHKNLDKANKSNSPPRIEDESKSPETADEVIKFDLDKFKKKLAELSQANYEEEYSKNKKYHYSLKYRAQCIKERARQLSLEQKKSETFDDNRTTVDDNQTTVDCSFSEPDYLMDEVNEELKEAIFNGPLFNKQQSPSKINSKRYCGLQEEFSVIPNKRQKLNPVEDWPQFSKFFTSVNTSETDENNVATDFDAFKSQHNTPVKNPQSGPTKEMVKPSRENPSGPRIKTMDAASDFDVYEFQLSSPVKTPQCDQTEETAEPAISPGKTNKNSFKNLAEKNKDNINSKKKKTNARKQSQNFRKLQIKKKIKCRGYKRFNMKKYKYQNYKKSKKQLAKCANQSSKSGAKEHGEEECDQISISDAEKPCVGRFSRRFDEDWLKIGLTEPCFKDMDDLKMEKLIDDTLRDFGLENFRPNQKFVIKRILCGFSTLLIAPTGFGKSLCYQTASYCYWLLKNAITIVVSPLISLMHDQMKNVPRCMKAVCYNSSQTESENIAAIDSIIDRKAQILFLSPEFMVQEFSNIDFHRFPKIAFVCIDEVHCMAEWSINFRPSYLELCKTLKTKFNICHILAMTATITKNTARTICKNLGISYSDDVIGETKIPDNLVLSFTVAKQKPIDLVSLLKSEPFCHLESLIIYCTQRDETESLASRIRASLKFEKNFQNFPYFCEAYHAGLSPIQRSSIQKRFMSGKLRIVVATIAFGMGIDKGNVRGVIHYSMPKSFENYVQAIGRAGRDGKQSFCHLLLDPNDLFTLHNFIYNNTPEFNEVKRFVFQVYKPCPCKTVFEELNEKVECPSHLVSLPISKMELDTNMKSEVLKTLLFFMGKLEKYSIQVLTPFNSTCLINFFGDDKKIEKFIADDQILSFAVAYTRRNNSLFSLHNFRFNVAEIARLLNKDAMDLQRHIKGLQWNKKTNRLNHLIKVHFSDYSFHLKSPGVLTESDLIIISSQLHRMMLKHEKDEIFKLRFVYAKFHEFALNGPKGIISTNDCTSFYQLSDSVKAMINDYFRNDRAVDWPATVDTYCQAFVPPQLVHNNLEMKPVRDKIADFIRKYGNEDELSSSRNIARILLGLTSPQISAEKWRKAFDFWRAFAHIDFEFVRKIAELFRF